MDVHGSRRRIEDRGGGAAVVGGRRGRAAAVVALAGAAALGYLLMGGHPGAQVVGHLVVHAGAVVAAVIGLRRQPRGTRRPWVLLGAGLAVYFLANIVFYAGELGFIRLGYPSVADLLYLAYYVLAGAGLASVHAARRSVDRGALTDALILTGGVAVAVWEFLGEPSLRAASAPAGARLVSIAYPLGDLFLLAVACRLALRRSRRSPALVLLGGYVLAQLVANVVYGRAQVTGAYHPGGIVDALWIVSLVCAGAAALDPDAPALGEPESEADGVPGWVRQITMTAAALVGPVFLAIQARTLHPEDLYVYAAVSAVLSTLAIGRVGGYGRHLVHRARHDALTGLPNRALLLDWLERALDRMRDDGGDIAVLFVDLDGFKAVNDGFGHDVGDELLVAVAGRLAGSVRTGDMVARLGGDEFVVACEASCGATDAPELAARLTRSLAEPVAVGGREVFVRASIGIRLARATGDTASDMLRDADAAMYEAKNAGRSGVALFDDILRRRAEERVENEAGLYRALERGEFRVHYQPTVAMDDGAIVGVEALVRWQHPTRGLLAPGDFIGVAEETGLIVPIGAWVLEEACRQWRSWRDAGAPPLTVSVNLSARQVRSPDLVAAVARIVARTGVDPRALCLEITESVLMDDAAAAAEVLVSLKALGVRIAIDDFGTGYSSLGYLRQFPVDVLKIDRGFVANLGNEAEPTAIVASVIQLAGALRLETVAEGVETHEQRRQLEALGCHLAQGYYWAKPLPSEALDDWLFPERAPVVPAAEAYDGCRPFRVVVADDEPAHRAMVRRILEADGLFAVVGEAADGRAAIELTERERPDLVVLDLTMPNMGGLEALPLILRRAPGTKVVLLSGHIGRVADEPLADGAAAFVPKGIAGAQLVDELLLVMGVGVPA